MTTRMADISPAAYARVAGLGYLIIIAAGIFAEFFIRSSLIVANDAAATAGNIAASQSLFRTGIAGDLIMLVCDIVVALALYMLFRQVNRGLSLLAAFFRLVHAAVYGVNLLNLVIVALLAGGAGYLAALQPSQSDALTMLFLDAHKYGYAIGLVFFGFHCMVLGYLVFKSGFLPRILGVLLLAASIGYLVDSFANILLPNYADYESVLMLVVFVPAFVAELSLSLWLLLKGVNVSRMRELWGSIS